MNPKNDVIYDSKFLILKKVQNLKLLKMALILILKSV